MNGRDNGGPSAIWATWSLDRLFIVDELANAKRAQAGRKRSQRSPAIPSGTNCEKTNRSRTHAEPGRREDRPRPATDEGKICRRPTAKDEG